MNALATVGMPRLPMLTSALTFRLSNLTKTLDSSTPALSVQVGSKNGQSAHNSHLRQARAVCLYALSNRLRPQQRGSAQEAAKNHHMCISEGVAAAGAYLSSRCLTFFKSSSLSCSWVSRASSSSARRSSGSTC